VDVIAGSSTARRSAAVLAVAAVAGLAVAPSALAQRDNQDGEDNKKPKACFTQSPASSPHSGQTVTFDSSCSSDPDGRIAGRVWDLDNDGQFDDGTAVTATHAWPRPGQYTVRLGVADDDGAVAIATKTITVANRGPTAAFSYTPAEPVAGQTVTLASTSADPDGTIASQSWDLNGDGRFDDGTAASASFTPPAAGTYPVGLRVVDDRGSAATVTKTFTVAARPADTPPPPTTPAQPFDDSQTTSPEPPLTAPVAALRWLDPFPTVRIRGRTTRSGVVLSLFTVRAPNGSQITLRCSGRGCPRKTVRKNVETRGGKPTANVRFKMLERSLRAGIRLQVLVTQPGVVGKYTRFKIRRLKVPVRTDRCVMPDSSRPVKCPGAA
jgi:PKD repeat protein